MDNLTALVMIVHSYLGHKISADEVRGGLLQLIGQLDEIELLKLCDVISMNAIHLRSREH